MKHSTKIKLTPNNTINEKVLIQDIKKTTSNVNQSFFRKCFRKCVQDVQLRKLYFF